MPPRDKNLQINNFLHSQFASMHSNVVQLSIKGQEYVFNEGSKTKEAKLIAIQRA